MLRLRTLLPLVLSTGCGGNVLVDPPAGGSTTTTTVTTTVTITDCNVLLQDLTAKNAAAQACNPFSNPPMECVGGATVQDLCGCPLPANVKSQAALAQAAQAWSTWAATCGGPYPCDECPPYSGSAYCAMQGICVSGP